MELNDDEGLFKKKKIHPLEIEDKLFEGVPPFTEEELEEAKESLLTKTPK